MAVEPRHYQFGPLERRGLLVGLRGGQLGALAASALLAIGLLRTAGPAGIGLAVGTVAASLIAAFWSVRGQTIEQWAPTWCRWGVDALRCHHRGLAVAPLTGFCRRDHPGDPAMIGPRRLELLAAASPSDDRVAGVLHDRMAGTYSAVLSVQGRSFALLDTVEKERRLSAWATVLSSLARDGSPIVRLQWVERSLPASTDKLDANVSLAGTGATPECLASYAELLAEAGPVTQDHEVFLVLSVDSRRAARAIRTFGGGGRGACALVAREVRLLEGQLRTAEITVDRILGPAEVEACIRRAHQPNGWMARPPTLADPMGRFDPWPMATEATWSDFVTDDVRHATYWVAEWPRVDVGPDFLSPLLLQSQGRRTVAVTMSPVSPRDAAREVEAARTADAADEELRRRAGFLSTARRRRQMEGVQRREADLADGHADYRYSGYVTVTAADAAELDRACAELERTAHQSHLELRRLFGRQREAFTWTLPLGRGLR
jgi:hypothetical protein